MKKLNNNNIITHARNFQTNNYVWESKMSAKKPDSHIETISVGGVSVEIETSQQLRKTYCRPVIYLRVSKTANADDLAGQLAYCKGELVKRWLKDVDPESIPVVSETNNMEAFRPKDKIWALMDDVVAGKYDTIITKDENRVLRSVTARGIEEVRSKINRMLSENFIKVVSCTGEHVFGLEEGLVEVVKTELGAEGKRQLSRTIQNGVISVMKEGKWISPATPFGYMIEKFADRVQVDSSATLDWKRGKRWSLVKQEADIVADIFRVASGLKPEYLEAFNHFYVSPRTIAIWLNSQPDKTSRRGFVDRKRNPKAKDTWNEEQVRRLLRQTAYYGIVRFEYGKKVTTWHKATIRLKIPVPAIVNEEIWQKAQAAAEARPALAKHDPTAIYSKLRCYKCNQGLSSGGNGFYRCHSRREKGDTNHTQVHSRLVDHVILETMRSEKFFDDLIASYKNAELAGVDDLQLRRIRNEMADCDRRLGNVISLMIDAGIDAARHLKDQRLKIEAELESLRREERSNGQVGERRSIIADIIKILESDWPDKNALTTYLVQHCIDRVVVEPFTPQEHTADRNDALRLFYVGSWSASHTAEIIGCSEATMSNYVKNKHPVARGLWSTNVQFQIQLRNGKSMLIQAPKVLLMTYQGEKTKESKNPEDVKAGVEAT
jgi:hypothetical protein